MRIPLQFLSAVVAIMALLDWRIYALLSKRHGKKTAGVHLLLSSLVWCLLIVAVCLPRRSGGDETLLTVMWLLFAVATVFLSKLVFVAVDLIACVPLLWHSKRWRAVSLTGLVLAAATFFGMWWGALINRFNIDVREIDIEIAGLPEGFEGYRILQFSDLHTGTYGTDTTFVAKLTDRINSIGADMIVFTGDIVNRHSDELTPFIPALSRLHAPDGVYSILGNHDYGDYYEWKSPEDKRRSFDNLIDAERLMGWHLLRDSHETVRRGNDSIAVIGVENIGDPPFPSYGSLPRATRGLSPDVCRILLSHNPAHWEREIASGSNRIGLTLAGHTHAMQIEIAGLSPAAWRYKRWGGLYSDDNGERKLYVNIGAGTVGMPMRVGATPELTVFTLHRKR